MKTKVFKFIVLWNNIICVDNQIVIYNTENNTIKVLYNER